MSLHEIEFYNSDGDLEAVFEYDLENSEIVKAELYVPAFDDFLVQPVELLKKLAPGRMRHYEEECLVRAVAMKEAEYEHFTFEDREVV